MKNSFLEKLLHRLDRLGPEEIQNQLQRLAREKGFLETIFNTLQEGILVMDPSGRILYLNHGVETLLGINPEQAIGHHVSQYLKVLDWAVILRERNVVSRDLEITYPEPRYLNFYLVPLDGGDDSGFAMIFHDLTLSREKTRETIESEKVNALMLLAAGVAHELGNPLNSLNIHFQLMERELKKAGKDKNKDLSPLLLDSVRIARQEISRLDTIINQFLRAVRPGAPERRSMSINQLMLESVEFLRPEITDRDVLIETELTEGLPNLSVDPAQIKQAFYNLIKNAMQAMGTGGILRIRSDIKDGHIRVTFIDTGTGISPENVAHIFEPYFTTKKSGSGLGLFIVRRIIREHGGELVIESHPGRGTAARILLPTSSPQVRLLEAGESSATK